MTSLRRLAPALSLVAVLALAACGTATDSGGDSSGTPGAEESTTDETTPADDSSETAQTPIAAADLPIEAGANGIEPPAGIDAPTNGGTGAAWTAEDGYLYVVTFGSSTCPRIADGEATLDGSDVVVTFEEPRREQALHHGPARLDHGRPGAGGRRRVRRRDGPAR